MSGEPLKPCPFCAAELEEAPNLATRNARFFVHPAHAEGDEPCILAGFVTSTANADRAAAWNTRPTPTAEGWELVAHKIMTREEYAALNLKGWHCVNHSIEPGATHLMYGDALASRNAEIERLKGLLNTPELHDFASGVVLEAAHQRERWGSTHDAGKAPEDWFWLLGYLGGKALHAAKAGDIEKALHHTISTAAALANWHAALLGASSAMRPGIDPRERPMAAALSTPKTAGETGDA